MLPSSQDLTFFLEMAKTLNISRSSERSGVTQSALSQSLKRLEKNIGVPLFIRTKTGLKLTKAGSKFLKKSHLILDTWENLRNDVIRDSKVLRGRYTLGMHEAVALYSLSSFLPQLMTLYPELEFSFIHEPSRILTEKVISFNLDFALVVNPIKHPDLIIKDICVDFFTLWVSPHINKKNKELPLIYTPDLIQAQTIKNGLEKSQFQFKRSILSSSIEVVKKCTLEKVGVGILPTRIAGLDLPKGEALKIYDQKAPKFKDKICLVYRYETQNIPAIKTLSYTLKKLLKPL
ncbi:MAG: LysR family transcriptional regulator [Halobacteriovoraceae bacterium]|nr:LysR family transcriptional regulator [Halobacteriovoraceae bacterium]|tara:strand:- start:1614 stop:2483 length:870 start_codon:yes stop_codon:yes gene_type:complete